MKVDDLRYCVAEIITSKWEYKKLATALLKRLDEEGISTEDKPKGNRTGAQNRSLHLWLTQVAQELDKEGHTIQNVVAKIQKAEIRPTGENLKEVLWRPYQIAATGKESSAKLDKGEVDRIYEGLNKFLGEHFHIHIPFPSDDARQLEQLGGYMSAAGTVDVPEMDETNNGSGF